MEVSELFTSAPEAFDEFVAAADPRPDHDGPPTARYQLACRKCAGRSFTLAEVLSGEHGTSGIEAACGQCGESGTVFHASRDGYDGRLGHLRFLQDTTGRKPLRDHDEQPVGEAQIACEVSYSIEPEELASTAAEEAIPAQDLFDGFALLVRSPANGAWRYVWDYECA